ncbi:phosphate starvation-inducible protein PhoH, partial [Enterococcus lactis]
MEVSINAFGTNVKVSGSEDNVNKVISIFKNLMDLIQNGVTLNSSDFVSAMNMAKNDTLSYFKELYNQILIKDFKGKPVR